MFYSTKKHRNLLRVNAGLEIVSSATENFSGLVSVAPKFAQVILSGIELVRAPMEIEERIIQLLLLILSSAYSSAVIMIYTNQNPFDWQLNMKMIVDILYQGVLLAAWAASEARKKEVQHMAIETHSTRSDESKDDRDMTLEPPHPV